MKSRNKLGYIVLIILAVSLAACTQSLSTAPAPQQAVEFPDVAATPGMNVLEEIASQTAMAESGQVPAAGETPAAVTVDPAVGGLPTLPALGGETAPTQDPATLPSPTPDILVAPQPVVETVRPASYTLQKGEFPYCIARRFNVNPADLLAMNGLSLAQSGALQPGLVLKIPSTGSFTADRALRAHPAQYTVQGSDTIYSIACLFGDVDPVNIAAVNGLSAPFTLTVGQILQIP